MAWAHVQTVAATAPLTSGTTIAIAPITVSIGDTIFVTVTYGLGSGNPTCADDLSNPYTQIGVTANDATDSQSVGWFYGRITTGGSATITGTFSNSSGRSILVSQYTGLATVSPLVDFKQTTNGTCTTGSNNATTPTTATPTATGQLVVGSICVTDLAGVTFTPGTGFVERAESATSGGANLEHEDRSAPSTSALGATWTSTVSSTHMQNLVAIFAELGAYTPPVTAVASSWR